MAKFKEKSMRLTTREKIIREELDICRENLIRSKLGHECVSAFEEKVRAEVSEIPFEERYPNLLASKASLSDEIVLLEFKLNFLKEKRDEINTKKIEQHKIDVETLKESEKFPEKINIKDMTKIEE